MDGPALGLLELASIAIGIEAGDAMAKKAPIEVLHAGTIHPGKYLILVGGTVADVEESMAAGRDVAAGCLVDEVFLPIAHPAVTAAIAGRRLGGEGEALGVIETATVAAIVDAADAGMKGARVRLLELRLGDGLGGKGYVLFDGAVSDAEAAVELGVARAGAARGPISRVIARLHGEMRENLEADARFRDRASHLADASGSVRTPGSPEAPSAPGASAVHSTPSSGSGPPPSSARWHRRRPGEE